MRDLLYSVGMSQPIEILSDRLPAEPLTVLEPWLVEAWRERQQPNPNAMVLATADASGWPAARVLLCKEMVPRPRYLVFFGSDLWVKDRELGENPRAAAGLYWDHVHRQVCIEGPGGPWLTAMPTSPPGPGRTVSVPERACKASTRPCASRSWRWPGASACRCPAIARPNAISICGFRARRAGAAITCGPSRWSYGWMARRASTTPRCGRGRSRRSRARHSTPPPGKRLDCSPERP